MSLSFGRDLVAIPGPSVIPDRVLRAMHRPSPNIYDGEIVELSESLYRDLASLAGTSGGVVIYIGNGHAAWEAAAANLLQPGDRVLVLATGLFALGWAQMIRRIGATVELLDFGFRAAADPDRLREVLAADTGGTIRAVLTVQTDTASSVSNDIPALRAAIDAAGHPALFMVDAIASFGCEAFEMDAWGVDVMVAACQKGLMTPPGLGFNFVGRRALSERIDCPSGYWDWGPRLDPRLYYQKFCGTPPTHHIYGLRAALDMIAEEGFDNTLRRHRLFASAIWAAVAAWGREGALELNIARPEQRSAAVTTIRTAPGDGARIRAWSERIAGLILGLGLSGPDEDSASLFRIGHMGHLNPPMVLGTLATIETALKALGIAHAAGGVEAAASGLATFSQHSGFESKKRENLSFSIRESL